MSYAEKDNWNTIEFNYVISKFRYTIIMEKGRYKLNKRAFYYGEVYTSVMHKLYNNVAISNKPPTFRNLSGSIDYYYTRIFI